VAAAKAVRSLLPNLSRLRRRRARSLASAKVSV
jgi:hypothetical protein